MSNTLYPSSKQQMLSAQLDWINDDIRIALYDALCMYDPTHTVISDLAGTQIAAGDALTGKAATDGYASSDTTFYNGLTSGLTVSIAIIYRNSDQSLVAYLDEVTGIPFQPVGSDYSITPGGPNNSYFQL